MRRLFLFVLYLSVVWLPLCTYKFLPTSFEKWRFWTVLAAGVVGLFLSAIAAGQTAIHYGDGSSYSGRRTTRRVDDVNIDGTPMCGGVDINGNPYGITS